MSRPDVHLVVAAEAELGESPVWTADGELAWVDTPRGEIHTTDVASGHDRVAVRHDVTIGAIAPHPDAGTWRAATSAGFAVVTASEVAPVGAPSLGPREFMNDAKPDRRGRLWSSVNDLGETPDVGYLCVWDGESTRVLDAGYTLANGIAWSPDDSTMYVIDSVPGRVWGYDYDLTTGSATNRRLICTPPGPGMPDGLAVDTEGCLWVAFFAGGSVRRLAPDGREVSRIDLPVSRPTSCAFGGDGRLFVTSAREGLGPDASKTEPMAGAVLMIDAGVDGIAVGP